MATGHGKKGAIKEGKRRKKKGGLGGNAGKKVCI